MRLRLLLLILCCLELSGQSKYIITNLNQRIIVDSIICNYEPCFSIKAYRDSKSEILFPNDIKGFITYYYSTPEIGEDKFESILNFKVDTFDYYKYGVFLPILCDGKIKLYILDNQNGLYFCALENNKWTLFGKDYIEKSKLFFKDKPEIYNKIINSIQDSSFTFDDIKYIIDYYNFPPSEYFHIDGFESIDSIYKDFVIALKTQDDNEILKFCKKIYFDSISNDYFLKYGIHYRDYPTKDYSKINNDIKEYCQRLIVLKNNLLKREQLDELKFIDIENKNPIVYCSLHGIEFSETAMISNINGYFFKLGEMMKINGKWKIVTEPAF